MGKRMRILLAMLLLLGASATYADMEGQSIEMVCDQSLRLFSITGHDEPSQTQQPNGTKYDDYERHRVRCVIRKTVIEADFSLSPPRDHGVCGVSPGGYVYAIKI